MRNKASFFIWASTLLLLCQSGTLSAIEQSVDVVVKHRTGDYSQATIQVAHEGQVLILDPERDSEPRSLNLDVQAKVRFSQRFTGNDQPLAIRNYANSSQADIQLSDGQSQQNLTRKNQYIIARIKDQGRIQVASIEDVLTQPEAELITTPCDPLCFPMLLQKENVQVGDRWKVTSEALASFLAVDRIYENKVQLQLREVKKNQAKIYLLGRAKTEIDDVTCDIRVTATLVVDMQKQKVVALRANIQQDRAIGQIAPGFKGTTKVDVRLQHVKPIASLSNKAIAKRTRSQKIERRLKWQSEDAGIALYYDPRWKMIASEKEAAVLRYIKHGSLLAQCNIVQLPSRPADNLLSMDKFKEEVQRITAKEESARIVEADRSITPEKLQALKVRVDGIEQKVPVSWIYYHVSHRDGRQVTFVFTLEQEVADQFTPADEELVESFQFLELKNRSANSQNRTTR